MTVTVRDEIAASPMEPPRESPVPTGSLGPAEPSVAETLTPLIRSLLHDPVPVRFEFWDGSALGPEDSVGTVYIRSVDALRRVMWAPGDLGLGRAYVSGEIELSGDLFATLDALHRAGPRQTGIGPTAVTALTTLPAAVEAARRLGALGRPLPNPPEEAKPAGRRHTPARDAAAISHHYDVSNDFYRLVLGPSMTYSCARFVEADTDLASAQEAKHELVCRKLGLHERNGARLLDVGCGWGSMAIHAATHFDASVVGVTLSQEQATLARRRVDEAGVADRVEIRVQDYRDLTGERFDVISSIGMFEHVGMAKMGQYFETLRSLLSPFGRLLNHAISTPGGTKIGRNTFMGRYVFPDGELLDVGCVVMAMQRAGFEVRDVESLREHYSQTLHAWVANLEEHWDEAVSHVGLARSRVWRLYMAASANGFDEGHLGIHQALGVVPDPEGNSGMPRTRGDWG
ncbi:MAG TPA: cyclopropane-fatty-acyl-phospholipid synthase family protein [Acidimicrobiales bacterium]|nr:cyclopropane-fatty-acyl-phospholipid synthase family protein [Acidimicrobiales bacterium]